MKTNKLYSWEFQSNVIKKCVEELKEIKKHVWSSLKSFHQNLAIDLSTEEQLNIVQSAKDTISRRGSIRSFLCPNVRRWDVILKATLS